VERFRDINVINRGGGTGRRDIGGVYEVRIIRTSRPRFMVLHRTGKRTQEGWNKSEGERGGGLGEGEDTRIGTRARRNKGRTHKCKTKIVHPEKWQEGNNGYGNIVRGGGRRVLSDCGKNKEQSLPKITGLKARATHLIVVEGGGTDKTKARRGEERAGVYCGRPRANGCPIQGATIIRVCRTGEKDSISGGTIRDTGGGRRFAQMGTRDVPWGKGEKCLTDLSVINFNGKQRHWDIAKGWDRERRD